MVVANAVGRLIALTTLVGVDCLFWFDSVEKLARLYGLRQNLRTGQQRQHDGSVIGWAGAAVSLVQSRRSPPTNHLLRSIDQSFDLSDLRHHLADY